LADLQFFCLLCVFLQTAIRRAITQERLAFERKEAKKKAAADAGEEYVSEEEAGEDIVPWITKEMLQKALQVARRSVSKQDLEMYMKYKRDMERRLGMDDDAPQQARVIGLDAENRHAGGAPAASTNSCVATPQTVAMTLAGAFSTSVSCHGLAPQEGIVIDSLLLRLNCGGLTIQGAVPPLTLTTDAGGGLAFNIAGFNCLAGNYSVQGVGVIDNLDFPVSLTF